MKFVVAESRYAAEDAAELIEHVLDLVARTVERDRAAVRLANLIRPAEMPYDVGVANYRDAGSVVYDSGDFPAVLRRALELARFPVPAVVASAVDDALSERGIRVTRMPLTPARLAELLAKLPDDS